MVLLGHTHEEITLMRLEGGLDYDGERLVPATARKPENTTLPVDDMILPFNCLTASRT